MTACITFYQLFKSQLIPKVECLRTPYLNFKPLEVVSRYRDPQLQVAEKKIKMKDKIFANFDVKTHISFSITVIYSDNKIVIVSTINM